EGAPLVIPSREEVARRPDHRRGEPLQALVMERGLRELALLPPLLALRRQEASAEDEPHPVVAPALHVVLLVVDEDAMDVVGPREEDEVERAEAKPHEVPEVARALDEE